MKFFLFIVLLWGLSFFAFAAELPPRIEISYLIKTDLGNGKLNETFEIIQESNRYRYSITSDARPSGLLKLIKPGSTQDRLNLPYNLMFSPLNGSHIDMHETNGHSLTLARYTVNQEILGTPLGKLETIVLTKQQEKDEKVDRKTWLTTAHHMLPVRIITTEKNGLGLELEQIVTKISYPYEH